MQIREQGGSTAERRDEIRLDRQCCVVAGQRVLEAPELLERVAAVVARLGKCWPQLERTPVALQCLINASNFLQDDAVVVVRVGIEGLQADDAPQQIHRLRRPSGLRRDDAKQTQRLGMIRLGLQHRAAQLLGRRQIPSAIGCCGLLHGVREIHRVASERCEIVG
jgi:hypothetical protein